MLERLHYLLARWLAPRPAAAARALVLARRIPYAAARVRVYRKLSWPLAHDLSRPLDVPTVGGTMTVDTGDLIGRCLAVSGVWEPDVTAVVRRLLRPGDVCIDVGAHIGYYSLLASSLVGEEGHVYAFEPAPERFAELRRNVERNHATNVTAFAVAAGEDDGRATLFQSPRANTSASTLVADALLDPAVGTGDDYEPVEVDVAPVQSRVPRDVWERVRLIKVDVEGYEVEALRGVDGVLDLGAPVAVLVELSPEWNARRSTDYVESLCGVHGLTAWRLRNEYSLDGYFPTRPQPPIRVASVPAGRCDLLLTRGVDPTAPR